MLVVHTVKSRIRSALNFSEPLEGFIVAIEISLNLLYIMNRNGVVCRRSLGDPVVQSSAEETEPMLKTCQNW